MLKVKVSNNFPELPILRQTANSSGIWGDCIFSVNDNISDYDFWVVYEGLDEIELGFCSPKKLIFIAYEPPSIKTYNPNFLNQFSTVLTCHKNINHKNVIFNHQGQPWFVNQNYSRLKTGESPQKSKRLSIISSEKRTTEAHRQRHLLCQKLKEYFGDEIDFYGRGIKDFEDKWDVIAPYQYSLAVENSRYQNYFTEKITDCFLGETIPFYYGCPNLEDFFSAKPWINIDIFDIPKTIEIIEKTIFDESLYTSHQHQLKQVKEQCLEELNLFSVLNDLITTLDKQIPASATKQKIKLYPEYHPIFLGDRLKRKFNKVFLGKRYDY